MVDRRLRLWFLPLALPQNPPLIFTPEAQTLLTPFRKRALLMMFNAALASGGDKLVNAASVDRWMAPAEESEPELVLNLLVSGSWDDVRKVRRRVVDRIVQQMASWSESERQDYAHMLYFSVGPVSP